MLDILFTPDNLNIFAQYSQSHQDIGYVVLDVDSPVEYPGSIQEKIRQLPNTVRAWLLKRV